MATPPQSVPLVNGLPLVSSLTAAQVAAAGGLIGGIMSSAPQLDKTADVAFADIGGFTFNVTPGKYKLRFVLHVAADAVGGYKVRFGGSATWTTLYQVLAIRNDTGLFAITARDTNPATSYGAVGGVSICIVVEGFINVSIAGTLRMQFAQQVAAGTSSLLAGSTAEVSQST